MCSVLVEPRLTLYVSRFVIHLVFLLSKYKVWSLYCYIRVCDLFCDGDHWLSRCKKFRKKTVEERFKLVHSLKLCDNCLTPGHVAKSCEKASFCKIEGCKFKYSTFLHRRVDSPTEEKSKSPQHPNGKHEGQHPAKVEQKNAESACVNVNDGCLNVQSVTGVPVL